MSRRQAVFGSPGIRAVRSCPPGLGDQAGVVLLFILRLVPLFTLLGGCSPGTVPAPDGPPATAVARRPAPPAPRPDDFIGSQACAACHAEIYEAYQSHPMGQSLHPIASAPPIETVPDGALPIAGPWEYRIGQQDGAMVHHELLRDAEGEVIYDQAEQIDYALGSGQRGRTYLIEKNGRLYQSPLGWYANGDRWDLSPGYDPQSHSHFQRRIGDGCLYCHAGRVADAGDDRYASPVFLEASIGCERCHGPGEQHRLRHLQPEGEERPPETIVNPVDLDVAARESVCNQCHLQGAHVIRRYGREFFDFRPGDDLEDIFVVLHGADRRDEAGRAQVVSQVEQMRASACYRGSDGRLGCISCHDPHRRPPVSEQAAFYRDRCLECHTDQGCALPEETRQAAPAHGSCIHCHMPPVASTDVPHTAQTNHQILRDPASEPASELPRETQPKPQKDPLNAVAPSARPVAAGVEGEVPPWEVDRARGIGMMTDAWNRSEPALALQSRQRLLPEGIEEDDVASVIAALREDLPALSELASSYLLTGRLDRARRYWQRVLEIDPDQETALAGLTMIFFNEGNLAASQRTLDRLLEIVPDDPQWHAHQIKLAAAQGDRSEAIEAAEKVLQLDPTRVEIRRWLAEAYRQARDPQAAKRHREVLERMRVLQHGRAAAPR